MSIPAVLQIALQFCTRKLEYEKIMSKGNVHLILKNPFYTGVFVWSGQTYAGTQPLFIEPELYRNVQSVLAGHNWGT